VGHAKHLVLGASLFAVGCGSDAPTTLDLHRLLDCDFDGVFESQDVCADDSPLCQESRTTDCCATHCATPASLSDECKSILGLIATEPACTTSATITDCDGDGVDNANDCADCDATAYQQVTQLRKDKDGDGHPEGPGDFGIHYYAGCTGTSPPSGYTFADATSDCNDLSPGVYRNVLIDGDGDGWTLSRCIGSIDPIGLTTLPSKGTDCDDADAAKQMAVYPDADGDGWFDENCPPEHCIGYVNPIPSGFQSVPGRDCDDARADIHPLQDDVEFDGVDSNCSTTNGESAQCQVDGVAMPDDCACWGNAACAWTTTCLDAPDLAIVATRTNATCAAVNTSMLIVNQGGIAFTGTVVFRHPGCSSQTSTSYWHDTTVSLTLAPGEHRIVEVAPECHSVVVEIQTGNDCNASNNSTEITIDYPVCD